MCWAGVLLASCVSLCLLRCCTQRPASLRDYVLTTADIAAVAKADLLPMLQLHDKLSNDVEALSSGSLCADLLTGTVYPVDGGTGMSVLLQ